jgi:hypothetical protein
MLADLGRLIQLPRPCEGRLGSRLCENAAVMAHRKGVVSVSASGDLRTVQARIASINDCGPSMASTRFRL